MRPPCDWDRAGKQREAPNRGRTGRTRQQQPRGEGSRRAPPEPVQEAHADAGWLEPAGDVGAAGAGLALSRGLDCGRPDRLSPSSLHHPTRPAPSHFSAARPMPSRLSLSVATRPSNSTGRLSGMGSCVICAYWAAKDTTVSSMDAITAPHAGRSLRAYSISHTLVLSTKGKGGLATITEL